MSTDRDTSRKTASRALRALAALGALAASTATSNADVAGATQMQLSPGTSIDVTGAGFGSAPRADLVVGGRRIALKIARSSIGDTQFRARLVDVPSGVSGAATLEVTPRGASAPFALPGFTIETPQITSIDPETGAKNTVVTITGSFFGTGGSTGHPPPGAVVRFGTRAAKIVTWTDTSIQVKVSVSKFGTYDVTVSNHAGSATRVGAFAAGDESVRGNFGATKFSAKGAVAVQAHTFTSGAHVRQMQVQAKMTVGGATRTVTIGLDFDPTLPFPQTLTNADLGSYSGGIQYVTESDATYYSNSSRAVVTVTLNSYVESPSEAVTGSFQATLVRLVAPGSTGDLLKCSGTFGAVVDD